VTETLEPTRGPTTEFQGCRFSYKLVGEGPPVLFIQGVGVHGDGWLPQTSDLSSDFQCLSFDNRGIGESQPAARTLTVEQMTDDALAILERVGWKSAHVVGHSLGGIVAQQLALSAPDRVRSLSLLCTVARGADATGLSWKVLQLGIRSSVGPLRLRRRAFLELVLAPATLKGTDSDALAERLKPLFGHDLGSRPPIAMKQLSALRAYDSRSKLAQLGRFPTLVVSAEHDPIAQPRAGRALAEGIPGARYVEIEGASHGVTIQLASRINELLRDHLTAAEQVYKQSAD
jgi:pimeloyl-ACP methyl ester carboxylesterase